MASGLKIHGVKLIRYNAEDTVIWFYEDNTAYDGVLHFMISTMMRVFRNSDLPRRHWCEAVGTIRKMVIDAQTCLINNTLDLFYMLDYDGNGFVSNAEFMWLMGRFRSEGGYSDGLSSSIDLWFEGNEGITFHKAGVEVNEIDELTAIDYINNLFRDKTAYSRNQWCGIISTMMHNALMYKRDDVMARMKARKSARVPTLPIF